MKIDIGKSDIGEISVNAQELVTGRTCVIAQSGAGKSWTLAVLCEQFLKNNVPFCVIDTEGEYNSLRQKFKILWVGGKKSDIELEKIDLRKLAMKIVDENIPVILDVSDTMDERRFVAEFTKNLYEVEDHLRKPYLLIIEEADKFVPQSKESMKQIEEIARRGRKRGLGLMLATQRPALVNKNILSQCSNQFIGKLTTENDLKAVDLFFATRKELEEVPELDPGEFFVMGNILRKKEKVMIRERVTKHKGSTPKLVIKKFKNIDFKNLLKTDEIETYSGSKKTKVKMLKPQITQGDAINVASKRRKKRFIFFGKKEDIRFAELLARPMINIQLTRREGLVKKENKKYSIIVDGNTGRTVSLRNGITFYSGFQEISDLNVNEVKVLLELNRGKKNLTDVKKKTKLSDRNVKSALNKLEKSNLITKEKVGRQKIYSLIRKIRLPELRRHEEVRMNEVTVPAKKTETILKKRDLENMISAFMPGSRIVKYEEFFYPIYSIHFERRIIEVDGIYGNII